MTRLVKALAILAHWSLRSHFDRRLPRCLLPAVLRWPVVSAERAEGEVLAPVVLAALEAGKMKPRWG